MTEVVDEVVRAVARGGRVRVIAVRCDGVARRLMAAHDPGPTGAVAISRVATGALLMGATLKGRQQVGVQLNGDGPLGEIYALADAEGHVRATLAEPRADVPLRADGAVDVANGIGIGRLTITKKLDEDAPAYRGVVPLVGGGVADDLAEYFTSSEQLPSAVAIGEVLGPDGLSAAGGLLVQMLPEASDEDAAAMEAAVAALPPLSTFLSEGGTAEQLAGLLGEGTRIVARNPVGFRCGCQREAYARALIGLGVDELTDLRGQLEQVECVCSFCGTSYVFNDEEMGALILGARMRAERAESELS